MSKSRRLRRLVPDLALYERRAAGESLRSLAPDYEVVHSTLFGISASPRRCSNCGKHAAGSRQGVGRGERRSETRPRRYGGAHGRTRSMIASWRPGNAACPAAQERRGGSMGMMVREGHTAGRATARATTWPRRSSRPAGVSSRSSTPHPYAVGETSFATSMRRSCGEGWLTTQSSRQTPAPTTAAFVRFSLTPSYSPPRRGRSSPLPRRRLRRLPHNRLSVLQAGSGCEAAPRATTSPRSLSPPRTQRRHS